MQITQSSLKEHSHHGDILLKYENSYIHTMSNIEQLCFKLGVNIHLRVLMYTDPADVC